MTPLAPLPVTRHSDAYRRATFDNRNASISSATGREAAGEGVTI
jgi:hypothetical protein